MLLLEDEVRGAGDEVCGDVFVLFRLARACGIDERAASLDQAGCSGEQFPLHRRELWQIARHPPPLDVGVATYRTETRAGGVDQYAVEGLVLKWQVTLLR